jgi:hypothetical protein
MSLGRSRKRATAPKKCNLKSAATQIGIARRMRRKVAAPLRPIFNRLLTDAAQAVREGRCQDAGRDIKQAKRLVPYRLPPWGRETLSPGWAGSRRRRR